MEVKVAQGLVRDLDVTLQPRAAPRYKVWLPLATQQLRLRSLCQVIGCNLETDKNHKICWFYFTLHRSSMSSPFYTSEPIDNGSPRWVSLEVPTLHATGLSTANEIILRLWRRTVVADPTSDVTVFTWGISFTGLVYMGPKLSNNLEPMLRPNSLIFHLYGGFFVPSYCLLHPPEFRRYLYMSVSNSEIRDSYTVSKLTSLRRKMHLLKQQNEATEALRERIASGDGVQSPKFRQTTLNRLLQPKRISKEKKAEILMIKKELEVAKFRMKLLEQERFRKMGELRALNQLHLSVMEENQDHGSLLMERYRELNKDMERLKEWRQSHIETREVYVQASAQLAYMRRHLMSDLCLIFPIRQESERKYIINNIHLPDSEELDSCNDIQTSAALGYVAQCTQMVANFLNVPTRYPILLSGSRTKIVDHINDNFPKKDRQFPLFSRSKDKLRFNYGVYLLNKNIAQLRWYCGLTTIDLRPTLINLGSLLNLKPNQSLDNSKRTFSGSSLDTDNSANGKHNVPLTPPLQKVVIDKISRTRTMSQLRMLRNSLGSSLDQGLNKPNQYFVLGKQSKRICKSEESAIDAKTFSLPRDGMSNSSGETIDDGLFHDRKNDRLKLQVQSNQLIEPEIEITIPVSVSKPKCDGDSIRQRSSNSISSCEMALGASQTEVNRINGELDDEKIETALNRLANALDNVQVGEESIESSEGLTISAVEKLGEDRSQETLTGLEGEKGVNDSTETLSSSMVSLDNTRNSYERIEERLGVACSCPESAKSFYDDGDDRSNWRTESNPIFQMSMERKTFPVPISRSQPNRVQETVNDFQASSEFINSIRKSSENVFARTEALASKKTSFKVMKPRF
ncbi:UV radiation resistance-associated gene protein [Fopius arisanus]|uniref:UV radiation resistance-associated gene protein n=1 Tax=Fopius arisanus TaxID=64838 RepID=A0A0C9PY37_9HYME|nr:PREDICTED: UV radiation resistance-associated gene protein [Fopius arisanus]